MSLQTDLQQTPVVLFIHQRPRTTKRVFAAIRAVAPPLLVVIADGPRPECSESAARCAAARAASQPDWPCQLHTLYSARLLGCKARIETGLDWVFKRWQQAIILEDDCLPEASFFPFCAALLSYYRDEPRILSISGNDFQPPSSASPYSYRFSRYAHIWGWACWRRAWQHYDGTMRRWPELRASGWPESFFDTPLQARYWTALLDENRQTGSSWDYAWLLSCWLQEGLHLLPTRNLVSNIGFGTDASHTHDPYSPVAGLPTRAIDLPLRHPAGIARDAAADTHTESLLFSGTLQQLFERLRARVRDQRGR